MTEGVLILVVEDEDLIRDLMDATLSDAGYTLVMADNGKKALEELEADATRFRAVVTDIRMGKGPDGWAIGQRAREHVAHMPVIYISGDSSHEWASRGVPGSIALSKPFAPAQLVTAVSNLITEADAHTPPPDATAP